MYVRNVRIFGLFLVLVFAGFIFVSGCSKETEAKQTVLKFACWGLPEELNIWQKMVLEFEKEHPDSLIKIEHTPGGYTYQTKVFTQIAEQEMFRIL